MSDTKTDTDTETKHTMKSMGRDEPLYHLFYSQTCAGRTSKIMCIKYLTEDGEEVEISEAIKVDDTNVETEALTALLADYRSRFPDGEYRGRGIWSSSRETGRSFRFS